MVIKCEINNNEKKIKKDIVNKTDKIGNGVSTNETSLNIFKINIYVVLKKLKNNDIKPRNPIK